MKPKPLPSSSLWVSLSLLSLLLSAPPSCLAAGWYRGDLHAHSTYSDGDSPVSTLIARAEALGLDFFTITDHDTSMGGDPQHWFDPAYTSTQMALLYGVEWTSSMGHANIWAEAPFAYTPLWEANLALDPAAALEAAHAQGALFSVNHPATPVSSSWDYPFLEGLDALEVWSAMYRFPSLNPMAVRCDWDTLLLAGRRLPCVGGSDTHELEGPIAALYGIGNPTTWVYAEGRSAGEILAGIRGGRTSLSYAPDALRIAFSADQDGDGVLESMIGDTLEATGKEVRFEVRLVAPEADGVPGRAWAPEGDLPLVVTVIKNGTLFKILPVRSLSPVYTFCDVPEPMDYYRTELVGLPDLGTRIEKLLYGRLLALSGPIWVGVPADTQGRPLR